MTEAIAISGALVALAVSIVAIARIGQDLDGDRPEDDGPLCRKCREPGHALNTDGWCRTCARQVCE